jgi:hypothetical protein
MFVNTQQIQLGVTNFIENEIAKKAVGFNKFAVYFAMPVINKKLTSYIDSFSSNPLTKEFFDENKNVDLDAIYNMAKSAVQKSGQFVYFGIMFNENDIDRLYSYIKGEI